MSNCRRGEHQAKLTTDRGRDLLWIKVQVCPVDLVKPPEQVLCGLVDVVPARVVGEVVSQW